METQWKKGQFVVNPKAMQWGIGIVIDDQRGDTLKVFFENECAIKNLGLKFVNPEEVKNPGSSIKFLQNALVDEDQLAKADIQPFPTKLKHFLEDFPDGFKGEMLIKNERNYKWNAHEYCLEHLNQKKFKTLLDAEKYPELSQEIKRIYSKVDFLASFEMMAINDAFKKPDYQKKLCYEFYNLLYGSDPIQKRFNQAVKTFSLYKMDKWPTITYPLFIRFPEKYLLVKPTHIKEAALNRGYDIQYTSKVQWDTYQRILDFGQDLFDRLTQSDNEMLHPKDMIDIQSFMWCTFANGWTREEIAKEKRALGIL